MRGAESAPPGNRATAGSDLDEFDRRDLDRQSATVARSASAAPLRSPR
jgi:hypothetical protein